MVGAGLAPALEDRPHLLKFAPMGLAPALEDRPHLLKFALMGLAPALASLLDRQGDLVGYSGGMAGLAPALMEFPLHSIRPIYSFTLSAASRLIPLSAARSSMLAALIALTEP